METVSLQPSSATTSLSTRKVNCASRWRSSHPSSIVRGLAGGASAGPSGEAPQPASAAATATARSAG